MTEQEFDRKVEEVAAKFEQRVEASADRLDRGLTQMWDGSRWFRLTAKAGSAAMGMGLLLGAASPAAKRFFDSGAVVRSRWACGACVRDGVQRFMEEVRMKAMKKEKLFTRNFTLLILG